MVMEEEVVRAIQFSLLHLDLSDMCEMIRHVEI